MRIVLFILALIAPILLLLSAGGAIHSLGDSLAVFRFHIGLFALASAVVLYRLDWRKFALAIAALSIAASGSILASYQHTHAHPLTYTLYQKNLSFRLQNPPAITQDVQWRNPDFVTFQEVTSQNRAILTSIQDTHPSQSICDFARVGGVAVASRFPAVPGTATCSETKGLAAIQLQTPDGPVWLVSIHLHWPYPFGQAQHVKQLLPTIETFKGKVILAGDFNMVPWAWAMREFERAQRALARRHHQFVLVLGHGERERRSDMRHRVAAGIGLGPARIAQGKHQKAAQARRCDTERRIKARIPRDFAMIFWNNLCISRT